MKKKMKKEKKKGKLTESVAKAAKPKKKPYKIIGSFGLYMEVKPDGTKRLKARLASGDGEKTVDMGRYPIVTVKEAKKALEDHIKTVKSMADPGKRQKMIDKANREVNNMQSAAMDWWKSWSEGKPQEAAEKMRNRIEHYYEGMIAKTPVSNLKAVDMVKVAHKVEERGIGLAREVMETTEQILRYALGGSYGLAEKAATTKASKKSPKKAAKKSTVRTTTRKPAATKKTTTTRKPAAAKKTTTARKPAVAKKTTTTRKPAAAKKTTTARKPAAAKKTTTARKPAATKKTTTARKPAAKKATPRKAPVRRTATKTTAKATKPSNVTKPSTQAGTGQVKAGTGAKATPSPVTPSSAISGPATPGPVKSS